MTFQFVEKPSYEEKKTRNDKNKNYVSVSKRDLYWIWILEHLTTIHSSNHVAIAIKSKRRQKLFLLRRIDLIIIYDRGRKEQRVSTANLMICFLQSTQTSVVSPRWYHFLFYFFIYKNKILLKKIMICMSDLFTLWLFPNKNIKSEMSWSKWNICIYLIFLLTIGIQKNVLPFWRHRFMAHTVSIWHRGTP